MAPIQINHQGQFPSVTISFNLAPGATIGQAVNAIGQVDKELGKPLSLATSFQGNAQAFGAALSSEPVLIAAAVFVIYIILGVLYESAIHPLTILSTLPAAGVGALLMLMAFGLDLSVIAIIGIILLIGIVKKNAIMLVDFAIQAEREGAKPEDAIYQACILRFRPILMTTMAALLGAVPLMVGTGTGSEIRQPLGYSIVGGLLVSQLLTLYTTPVVYLYLDRLRARIAPTGGQPAGREKLSGACGITPGFDRCLRFPGTCNVSPFSLLERPFTRSSMGQFFPPNTAPPVPRPGSHSAASASRSRPYGKRLRRPPIADGYQVTVFDRDAKRARRSSPRERPAPQGWAISQTVRRS